MSAPKLEKIVVNMGTRDLLKDKKTKAKLVEDLAAITGQKPRVQKAKISVAGFGIREGNEVGLMVTLRGDRMYAFLERLISIVLPRLRDFRGVSPKSFDNQGNFTIGLAEYNVFPEIDIVTAIKSQGLEITIVTSTKDKKEAHKLLSALGMPFEKN